MPDINALFPSKWLKAADIEGRDVRGTIVGVDTQEVGDDDIKPVVTFRERELKPLVLNKTNANLISAALGTSDTRHWIGRTIVLFATTTEFGGRRVPCIRVRDRVPAGNAQQRQADPRADYQRPLREAGEDDGMPPADPGWDRPSF